MHLALLTFLAVLTMFIHFSEEHKNESLSLVGIRALIVALYFEEAIFIYHVVIF